MMNTCIKNIQDSRFRIEETDGAHHDKVEDEMTGALESLSELVCGLLEECGVECMNYEVGINPHAMGIIVNCDYGEFLITQDFDNSQEIILIDTCKVPYEIMEFCNELRFRNAEGVIENILKDVNGA